MWPTTHGKWRTGHGMNRASEVRRVLAIADAGPFLLIRNERGHLPWYW
jgi:hypothetical protein